MVLRRDTVNILLFVISMTTLLGCASSALRPDPPSTYLSRAIERSKGGVSVAASVMDEAEISDCFGVPLNSVGIQPVWLKIQNLSAYSYVLFLRSIDPDYFSPYEVARRSSNIVSKTPDELYPLIHERNHMRLWLAPVTHNGVPVWVGHISRDAGIKFADRLWPPTTHVIDPAVDEARFYIERDLLFSQRVQKIGLVGGVQFASPDKPRTNGEGDPYFTDGLRAVFFVGDQPTPIDGLEVLKWRLPPIMEPFRDSFLDQSEYDDL